MHVDHALVMQFIFVIKVIQIIQIKVMHLMTFVQFILFSSQKGVMQEILFEINIAYMDVLLSCLIERTIQLEKEDL